MRRGSAKTIRGASGVDCDLTCIDYPSIANGIVEIADAVGAYGQEHTDSADNTDSGNIPAALALIRSGLRHLGTVGG